MIYFSDPKYSHVQTQTVVINGQAYQIMSPVNLVNSVASAPASVVTASPPASATSVQFNTSGTGWTKTSIPV